MWPRVFADRDCVSCAQVYVHDSTNSRQSSGYCYECAKKADDDIYDIFTEKYQSKYPNLCLKITYHVEDVVERTGGYDSDPDLEDVPDYDFTACLPILNEMDLSDKPPLIYEGYPNLGRYSRGSSAFRDFMTDGYSGDQYPDSNESDLDATIISYEIVSR